MENLLDFTGKVAIVTGSRSGIGKATAILYAQQGAKVVLAGRREMPETQAAIEAVGGESIYVKTDVMDEESVANLVKTAVDTYGRLDVAVNNAGTNSGTIDLVDYPTEDYNRINNVDARGVFFSMKYEIAAMLDLIEKGVQEAGNIVNISSVAGLIADPGMSPYVAAKHACTGLTKAAAIEYAERKIRINGIAPGFTASEMTQFWIDNPEMCELVASYNFQKRIADPKEIGYVALFLGSDMASFMGGAIIPVDAGQVAH